MSFFLVYGPNSWLEMAMLLYLDVKLGWGYCQTSEREREYVAKEETSVRTVYRDLGSLGVTLTRHFIKLRVSSYDVIKIKAI